MNDGKWGLHLGTAAARGDGDGGSDADTAVAWRLPLEPPEGATALLRLNRTRDANCLTRKPKRKKG